ncbi:valine--tRNA ligase [Candidatus Velamenicoccus archaeovorus]|uniref:Valine--tRNA ligase n=1 Tax=Velamenicoccus archaeovorus TaxID=1930593 RepID=A0A410P4G2_VELA1|nr:valine--tRNA ligase [Candidatus Velamenicoccus archaeovorus]QAT17095.1 valine--tRNA ligase [Candidatus Velamenicoccus archaeovorus]
MNDLPRELSAQYNPKEVEEKWAGLWARMPLFHASVNPDKEHFTIVIPPPNVTGILHMGHALNNTLQDILIRMRRMQGCEALWMPGTDHAGIATQNVVERQIAKEGLTRGQMGREKFLEKVWEWKENYGSTIINQLKRLGATCDWQRERFTMDEGYSRAITEVFVSLYEKDLIYQGDYIINWCPRCQTALSDEEAPHHDLDGKLYYIKYPLKEPQAAGRKSKRNSKKTAAPEDGIIVATTRPETMLGDTAVAVNPKDKRYKHLIGATLVLPLVGREIGIIADDLVDKSFGTGAVKVTPAHDPNDYQMGKTHELEFINIMQPDAVLNAHAGDYAGMDRFEAREAIIEDLTERKLLVKIEPHRHAVGHCYRCHTIVEPYLSKQWFVRTKPLAKPAIDAVKKGKIAFTPQRWTKVYLNWMENIKDWCISRQIWWGHRLPVYYCQRCMAETGSKSQVPISNFKKNSKNTQKGIIVARVRPEKCPDCGGTDLKQDEDVLDTWFSSWLWPFATFGWPFSDQVSEDAKRRTEEQKKELEYFYPTSVLVTAPEIIFFWVARMIMAGFAFMGSIPFKDVFIHGTVRDAQGRKMSKSLGNSIDPLEVIETYGADALRFSLISACASDIFLSKEKFEQGRNFANKIWNASRFIRMNAAVGVDGSRIDPAACRIQDLWILAELNDTIRRVTKAVDAFRFHEAVNLLYTFFWHSFCDWYVEMAKQTICEKNTQEILVHVLKVSLLLLHPFMPFITDEISSVLGGSSFETIAVAPWPQPEKKFENKEARELMRIIFDAVLLLRERRHELKLNPAVKVRVRMWAAPKKRAALLAAAPVICQLAQASELEWLDDDTAPQNSLSLLVARDAHLYLLLEGLVDIAQERERLAGEIAQGHKQIKAKEALLKNKGFVKKAPEQVVAAERKRLEELKAKTADLEEIRRALQ